MNIPRKWNLRLLIFIVWLMKVNKKWFASIWNFHEVIDKIPAHHNHFTSCGSDGNTQAGIINYSIDVLAKLLFGCKFLEASKGEKKMKTSWMEALVVGKGHSRKWKEKKIIFLFKWMERTKQFNLEFSFFRKYRCKFLLHLMYRFSASSFFSSLCSTYFLIAVFENELTKLFQRYIDVKCD